MVLQVSLESLPLLFNRSCSSLGSLMVLQVSLESLPLLFNRSCSTCYLDGIENIILSFTKKKKHILFF
jgi:hypothetical protein